jgi:phosphoglycolate phosphatase
MTANLALDTVIRDARYLLFVFDGPIRSVDAGKPADSTTTTAPHIHEALAACRESGRSAAIISSDPPTDVRAYLDAHGLLTQVAVVASSISKAASALETSPADCLLITSSPTDIKAAQAAGVPSIGYANKLGKREGMTEINAGAVIGSIADLALSLRAHPLQEI